MVLLNLVLEDPFDARFSRVGNQPKIFEILNILEWVGKKYFSPKAMILLDMTAQLQIKQIFFFDFISKSC